MATYHGNSRCNDETVRAAARVFAEYGPFIRGVIRFHVSDPSRQEDVYQEFFLKLMHRPVPPDVRNVKGYLYRAVSNDIVDLTRRQETYQHHLKNFSEKSEIPVNKEGSRDAIIVVDQVDCVFRQLARWLRPREAEVLAMRYRDDYTVAEIAARLCIPRRTVSRYLSSGLGKLRKALVVE